MPYQYPLAGACKQVPDASESPFSKATPTKHWRIFAIQTIYTALREKRKIIYVEPDIIFIEDVAKMLHCTKQTVYKYTSLGKIPHTKPGQLLMFNRATILKWMASKERGPHVK